MAVKSIQIDAFTVFEKLAIEFSSGINVFIGENGTGKTHLLKLLYAAHVIRSNNPASASEVFGEDFETIFTITHKDDSLDISYRAMGKGLQKKARKGSEELIKFINENDITPDDIGIVMDENTKIDIGEDDPPLIVVSDNLSSAIFIPAKDMLTHGRLEKDYREYDLPFDTTLIDILDKAGTSALRNLGSEMAEVLTKISAIIGGNVVYRGDRYYIQKQNNILVGFDMEAEGFKKLGLIYRLIETGHIRKGSVLLWDEPEANINPKLIPDLVDIILTLEQAGVQMFFATHDYFFAKFLEVRKKKDINVMYFALYKGENDKKVQCESNHDFELLENNSIIAQSIALYKEEVKKVMA